MSTQIVFDDIAGREFEKFSQRLFHSSILHYFKPDLVLLCLHRPGFVKVLYVLLPLRNALKSRKIDHSCRLNAFLMSAEQMGHPLWE